MDHLRSFFRALIDKSWNKQGFVTDWFRVVWEDLHTKTSMNSSLIQALLVNKEDGSKRFGAKKVDQLFKEELDFFQKSITHEGLTVEAAHMTTAPIISIPFALVRQEPVGHGGFHTGVLGTQNPLFRWV